MKKSEIYTLALESIVDSLWIDAGERLEVIEQLLEDRKLAEWREGQEAQKAQEQESNA